MVVHHQYGRVLCLHSTPWCLHLQSWYSTGRGKQPMVAYHSCFCMGNTYEGCTLSPCVSHACHIIIRVFLGITFAPQVYYVIIGMINFYSSLLRLISVGGRILYLLETLLVLHYWLLLFHLLDVRTSWTASLEFLVVFDECLWIEFLKFLHIGLWTCSSVSVRYDE